MKNFIVALLFICLSNLSFAGKIENARALGIRMSRVALAMDKARDEVVGKYNHKQALIGEYVPVIKGANFITVMCFKKNTEIPLMRFTIEESDTIRVSDVDSVYMVPSETELKILRIMTSAREIYSYNGGEFFKFDGQYTYKMVPVFMNKYFELYLMPMSTDGSKVILGGDNFVRIDLKSRLMLRQNMHEAIEVFEKSLEKEVIEHRHGKRNKNLGLTDFFYAHYYRNEVNWNFLGVIIKKNIYLINKKDLSVKKFKLSDYEHGLDLKDSDKKPNVNFE